ncbi:hypothetical protein [Paenarthrobacter sp. NPDC018779]
MIDLVDGLILAVILTCAVVGVRRAKKRIGTSFVPDKACEG